MQALFAGILRRVLQPRDETIVALLGALILFIAVNTQTGWLYLISAAVASLLLVGFVVPRLMLSGLELSRGAMGPVVEGETVEVRLRLHNPSRWPRYLVTVEEHPPFPPVPPDAPAAAPLDAVDGMDAGTDAAQRVRFVVGCVPAHGAVSLSYRMTAPFRGVRRFEVTTMASSVPFGFFPRVRRVNIGGEAVVLPRAPVLRHADRARAASRVEGQTTPHRRLGRSHDLHGLRAYQYGDDIRSVHWPTSARTGTLTVTEHLDIGAPRLTVVIDCGGESGHGPAGLSALDQAARLAAAFLAHDRRRGTRVRLVTLDGHGALCGAADQRGASPLDWLARLASCDAPHWARALELLESKREPAGHVLVLTTRGLSETNVSRLPLPAAVVLFAGDDEQCIDEAATLVAAGARVFVHATEAPLEGIFSGAGAAR